MLMVKIKVDGQLELNLELKILIEDGTIVVASRDYNSDIFMSTVGGFGLTGIICEQT